MLRTLNVCATVVCLGLLAGCGGSGGGKPPPVLDCPVPTSGPTHHKGDVGANEIWTAATSPHLIDADVHVRDGAKLIIEPCVEVRLAADAHLNVAFPITPNTGTLIAEGTETKPITFKAQGANPWASVKVVSPGTARLAWVTLEGGGSDDFEEGATIDVQGGAAGAPLLFVDHVTVKGSQGTGVFFDGRAGFAPGSSALTITGSGGLDNPYPLTVSEHALDSIPTGAYTGNKVDEIVVDPLGTSVAGEGLSKDATLHERGVPYHVGRSSVDALIIGGAQGTVTTLTIEPGVVMKFEPQTALQIQHFTTTKPATGALRALGTAEKPVVFTSAAATPAAGDWRGLWFGGLPQANNRLDHVRIEYAGYDCHCSLVTCSRIAEYEAAVIFTAQPPSAFITNTTFANIAGHGVTQGFDGSLVDFRSSNSFVNVSGCEQTRPRNTDTTCPDPKPACD